MRVGNQARVTGSEKTLEEKTLEEFERIWAQHKSTALNTPLFDDQDSDEDDG